MTSTFSRATFCWNTSLWVSIMLILHCICVFAWMIWNNVLGHCPAETNNSDVTSSSWLILEHFSNLDNLLILSGIHATPSLWQGFQYLCLPHSPTANFKVGSGNAAFFFWHEKFLSTAHYCKIILACPDESLHNSNDSVCRAAWVNMQSVLHCGMMHNSIINSKVFLKLFGGGLWFVCDHSNHSSPSPFRYFSWPTKKLNSISLRYFLTKKECIIMQSHRGA